MQNYYATLQISMQATPQEVKAAYRSLARKYHPDVLPAHANATELFLQIQRAYEVLSSPIERKRYDQLLLKQNTHISIFEEQVTPDKLFKQSNDLLRYILNQDKRVINNDALADYILSLLSKPNLEVLLFAQDSSINSQIAKNILEASSSIVTLRLFQPIADALLLLHPLESDPMKSIIVAEIERRRAIEQEQKIVPFVSIFLILLFVLIMWAILA